LHSCWRIPFAEGVFWRGVFGWLLTGLLGHGAPLSLLSWNVAGNGASDWTTNALQVRAMGRIIQHVQPDIITFQEIPHPHVTEMTNFVTAFVPGYHLARLSGTDGSIRSVILSRHPITRKQRWLDGVLLNDFGYDGRFTRDLFEAEITVPGWPLPLHVFTTHLKAGFDADSVARRGAEALAISNFVVNTHYPQRGHRPFVLTGDFNEDVVVHANIGGGVVPKLTHEAVGFRLTTPVHPLTGSERTFSARASLSSRLDYILPNGLLYSNILASQTFRTGLLDPLPPGLLADDDRTASDHLAVLMVFANPYLVPFRITELDVSGDFLTLRWEAQAGRRYTVEWSPDLEDWRAAASGILVGGAQGLWNAAVPTGSRFYRVFQEAPP
jgi:endonuclease/exonuclease/phosphatase family metal-dependent hydrolase